ncbi:MAG: putative integrase [Sulfolobaceae archaeon]
MVNKTYTSGDIRIREVKGKYYIYVIEKDNEGKRKDRYVGPLSEVVKLALAVKGMGAVPPTMGPQGFEPWTTRL